MILAAMPLTAELGSRRFSGTIFGTTAVFGHIVLYQFLELRFYPLVALPFLIISFAALVLKQEKGFHAAKVFFAMGLGPLGFSLLRFIFFRGYAEEPLWADAWEEITEFLFVILILWIALRMRFVSRSANQSKEALSLTWRNT
jgi:hypothetical protein